MRAHTNVRGRGRGQGGKGREARGGRRATADLVVEEALGDLARGAHGHVERLPKRLAHRIVCRLVLHFHPRAPTVERASASAFLPWPLPSRSGPATPFPLFARRRGFPQPLEQPLRNSSLSPPAPGHAQLIPTACPPRTLPPYLPASAPEGRPVPGAPARARLVCASDAPLPPCRHAPLSRKAARRRTGAR